MREKGRAACHGNWRDLVAFDMLGTPVRRRNDSVANVIDGIDARVPRFVGNPRIGSTVLLSSPAAGSGRRDFILLPEGLLRIRIAVRDFGLVALSSMIGLQGGLTMM